MQTYKYENPWHALAEPLEHLPEAQGVKYHLQLNIYRFILDKYYGHIVSSMLVVCLHPGLQDGHWADVVPAMPAEICAIMQVRRDEVRRQCFWLHPVHCSESCYRIRCLPPLGDESGFWSVPGPEKLACFCHRHIMFQLFVRLAILGVKTVERCSGMCAAEVCSMKTVATKHLRITDVTA